MIDVKKLSLRIFFVIEITIFFSFYFFGNEGYKKIKSLKIEKQNLEKNINSLNENINLLAIEIEDFKKFPYYKEKIAREHLQLAKKNDQIYLLN
ncbi:septum formation initiator family protein [Candidatus Dependentiae bacterium]|nr:septum formation initiator family protein [Candidatus Dependentiae bacterium]